MKFAIAYCRQSFQRPDKVSTVTWQRNKIETNAEKLGINIQEFFSEVKSGKNTDRTEYQRMVTMIKSERVSDLFVYRIDRLSRNTEDLLDFLEMCAQYDVDIRSLVEGGFDYSKPSDRIKLQTFAIIGELQRTISKENREINNIKKFNTGKIVNYVAPFGYHYHQDQFFIVPTEAKTVQYVFDEYLKGLGYKRIAQLTEQRPDLIQRNPQQVRNILTNLKYTGDFKSKHGILDNVLPVIVSKETYAAAEKERQDRASHTTQRYTVTAKLRKKIFCPHCQQKMTTFYNRNQTNAQSFYVCQQKMSGQYNDCPMPFIPLKIIEHKVLQQIVQFLISKDQLNHLHQRVLNKIEQTQQQLIQETRLYESQKDRLIEQLAVGKITLTAFQDRMASIESKRTKAKEYHKISLINPHQISELIQMNPNLHDELLENIKYVKIDTNQNLIDVRLEDIDINIINFNAKEPILNE